MNPKLFILLTVTVGWLGIVVDGPAQNAQPRPLLQAHAHNDYEHPRPLLDALDHGFCNVEADVWLVDGQLLVAHDRGDARRERTLAALYLQPLRQRISANGGRVFSNGPTVTLLVDVKSEATNTYIALREVLQSYRSMLTVFHRGATQTNAVTVIVSGNRARGLMESEGERLAAYDGRLADLESDFSPHFIPLISDNWRLHFRWKGEPEDGRLSVEEKAKLDLLVERAHRRQVRLRFWGMPDSPAVWQVLREAKVDLINTDQLDDLAKFLK